MTFDDQIGGDFTRIGPAGRRSLWLRFNYEPSVSGDDAWIATPETVESIELRAGREGDDASIKIGRDNPQFAELLGVMCVAVTAAEFAEEPAR